MRNFLKILLCVALCIGGVGCDDSGTTKTLKKAQPKATNTVPKVLAPPFNADSTFAYIERQLAFGPRVPNTKGHRACATWLKQSFRDFGATVTSQPTVVQGVTLDGLPVQLQMENIIASFLPESKRRIIISAHWDSRPYGDAGEESKKYDAIPGANDGGSGVAILMELARQLGQKAPTVGVDLCLWDAEDYGNPDPKFQDTYCLGSQYWSKHPHKAGYRAMYGINLDMVGAAGATFLQDQVSKRNAQNILDKVWTIAAELGYNRFFPSAPGSELLDDHYYLNKLAQIPFIDVIDQRPQPGKVFFGQWHTHQDDIHIIDKTTLKAVGQTMLEVIYRE